MKSLQLTPISLCLPYVYSAIIVTGMKIQDSYNKPGLLPGYSGIERKKIIIVDDDALLTKTIHMCLSKKGHDVKVSFTGADAVRCLSEEKPDLLVLDIRLPDCNGWSLARLVEKRERAEKVPLIIISALEPDRERMAEVKPYAYIQKPFDMEQLIQTVERSLAGETSLACI